MAAQFIISNKMQKIGSGSHGQEKKDKRKLIPLPTYNDGQQRKERRDAEDFVYYTTFCLALAIIRNLAYLNFALIFCVFSE
ncbi:hypothetical protein K1719_044938 [Acacia pycnantha]|nr:hypothetical protein K1719_044938 [Acacia pycnantha]